MGQITKEDATEVGKIIDKMMEDPCGNGLTMYKSVAAHEPEMFKKHFGHLNTDELLGKQGRNVLMFTRAVNNCYKEGNETDAEEKMRRLVRTHTQRSTDLNEWDIVLKGQGKYFEDFLGGETTQEMKDAVQKIYVKRFYEVVKDEISKL